jgi:hypothetical protein
MTSNVNNLKETLLEQKKKVPTAKAQANFWEVMLKFILTHMEKITLIFMYFIAVNNVSVVHFSKKF